MADTLEKTISVDLSSLDAKLSLAEKVEKKVERDAEHVETKLKSAEKQAQSVERAVGKMEHRVKHVAKHLLREGITLGAEAISGGEPGSAAAFGGNLLGAGISGAAFGPGAAITAIVFTAISEFRSAMADAKQKQLELAKKVEESKQAFVDYQRAKQAQEERDELDLQQRFAEIEQKAQEKSAELIYQSSQYLEQ